MANQDIFGIKKKKHGPHGVLVTPVVPPKKDETEAPETSNQPSNNGGTPKVGGFTTSETVTRDEYGREVSRTKKRNPMKKNNMFGIASEYGEEMAGSALSGEKKKEEE